MPVDGEDALKAHGCFATHVETVMDAAKTADGSKDNEQKDPVSMAKTDM